MARWEEGRESERRRLLLEEAEIKQKGGLWIKGKDRNENGFLGKWMSRYQLILLVVIFFSYTMKDTTVDQIN